MNLNDSPNLKLPCPSSQHLHRGFYASVFDIPEGGEEENDGAASSRSRLVEYQLHFQQLRASGVYILEYVMGSKLKLCS